MGGTYYLHFLLLRVCAVQGRSCKKALSLLQRGDMSLDAVQEAVGSLEADECLNAGAFPILLTMYVSPKSSQDMGQISP